jgi:hypothetical protein
MSTVSLGAAAVSKRRGSWATPPVGESLDCAALVDPSAWLAATCERGSTTRIDRKSVV